MYIQSDFLAESKDLISLKEVEGSKIFLVNCKERAAVLSQREKGSKTMANRLILC